MPSKPVSLHYRVNVRQKTGEVWKDAKLILSTSATSMLDAGVPASDSLVIQPKEKPPPPPPVLPPAPIHAQMVQYRSTNRSVGALPAPTLSPRVSQSARRAPPPPLVQTAAIVSKSPAAVSYTVDEYTTIPSDYMLYKVLVAVIPFQATISHITSPRKSPIAYLQVSIRLAPVHSVIKCESGLSNSA